MNLLRGLFSLNTAAHTSLVEDTAVSFQQERNRVRRIPRRQRRSVLRGVSFSLVSVVFCCLLFVAGSFAHAQSTFGSVRGNVLDASGAAIPGAQIVLHST